MQISTGPILKSKKTGEIRAYHDSALFYTIKGNSIDRKQEGLPPEPYGIIVSHYNNPFDLSFNEDDLTVSIGPGILHVYGRQIELTEEVEVYDFHSTLESQIMFCTVYVEVNLADMTRQMARLKIDIAGSAYKNFDSSMTRDNLHVLDHGVFQAPIARFQYSPMSNPHFSNKTLVMPIHEIATRESVQELNMTDHINNTLISELAEKDETGIAAIKQYFKFKKASNQAATEAYNSLFPHSNPEGTAGYNSAKEAEKFGNATNHDTTSINANLAGVLTVKRIKVTSLGTWFGSEVNYELDIKGDTSKIQAIRLHFSKDKFAAEINYQRKYLFTGWQWQDQYATKKTCILNPNGERWFGRENKKFCLYYYHYFVLNPYIGYLAYEELEFGTYENFQNAMGTEDAPNWATGSTSSMSISTKRRFMDVDLTIESNKINLKFQGHGYSGDFYEFLQGWYRWCPLQNIEDAGDLYLDIIYKGDVRL